MLNKIPKILSPELVKTLMEMGHGDEILLADANYPGAANNEKIIRADGIGIPDLLDAILELMPLDSYEDYSSIVMQVVEGDSNVEGENPPIWNKYEELISVHQNVCRIKTIERKGFYKYSNSCFAIVQTGETAMYGNIILRKGVVF